MYPGRANAEYGGDSMIRVRLLLGVICLCGGASAGLFYWSEMPGTPHELYEKRCTACHQLPDLSDYQCHELAPLVDFMRKHNGANRIITDREAQMIIGYLEDDRCVTAADARH